MSFSKKKLTTTRVSATPGRQAHWFRELGAHLSKNQPPEYFRLRFWLKFLRRTLIYFRGLRGLNCFKESSSSSDNCVGEIMFNEIDETPSGRMVKINSRQFSYLPALFDWSIIGCTIRRRALINLKQREKRTWEKSLTQLSHFSAP